MACHDSFGKGLTGFERPARGSDAHEDIDHVEYRAERVIQTHRELGAGSQLLHSRSDQAGALHAAFKNRFNAMWNDGVNYVQFQPQNPAPQHRSSRRQYPRPTCRRPPGWNGAGRTGRRPTTSISGQTSGNPPLVATRERRSVQQSSPRRTWSTSPQPLQPNTAYYWKVISRTFATDVNPAIAATSEFWGFTTAGSGSGGSTPFGSGPVALPGTIQAENFDNGGANVAYVDTSSGNSGGAYRTTDVDVEATTDTGGGNNIGGIEIKPASG